MTIVIRFWFRCVGFQGLEDCWPSGDCVVLQGEAVRDGVQQFCEKHLTKIKTFINKLNASIPLPIRCSVVSECPQSAFCFSVGVCGGVGVDACVCVCVSVCVCAFVCV